MTPDDDEALARAIAWLMWVGLVGFLLLAFRGAVR
jgi:hypothetical protein